MASSLYTLRGNLKKELIEYYSRLIMNVEIAAQEYTAIIRKKEKMDSIFSFAEKVVNKLDKSLSKSLASIDDYVNTVENNCRHDDENHTNDEDEQQKSFNRKAVKRMVIPVLSPENYRSAFPLGLFIVFKRYLSAEEIELLARFSLYNYDQELIRKTKSANLTRVS